MPTDLYRTFHPRFDAIICDIDGCLVPETSTPFDVDSLARIARHNALAQEKRDRPLLTLCSGRPQPFAESIARLTANTTLPIVCENGVWLYTPGANLYQMDPAITPAHKAAVREAANWLDETYRPRGVQQQPGKAASISLYHPEPEFLRSICPEIDRQFAARQWPMRVSMTWNYINCDLKHISKSTGLDRFIAATGLTKARLAGIGDTLGDLAIREHVAWFACPANAAEEIKRVSDFVAPSPLAAGVVEILNSMTK